jgi:hypothetical protein
MYLFPKDKTMEDSDAGELPLRITDPGSETTGPRVLSALRGRRPSDVDIDTLVPAYCTLVERLCSQPIAYLAIVDRLTAIVVFEDESRLQIELVTGVDTLTKATLDGLLPLLCKKGDLLLVTDGEVDNEVRAYCEGHDFVDYARLTVDRRSRQ